MRKPARRQHLVAEINITPFTDVVLVLLIIFMIATPLISQSSINVSLPKAKSGATLEGSQEQKQADITITREGAVYLDGKIINRKNLQEKIRAMHNNNPDLIVVVRSDKFVKFQDIVDVLDPLAELGISRLNIAATKED